MPPRDGAATRRRILDAATAEFAEHGLAGARVERIARRAEANPKMLYTYFGSKDALFDAVVDTALDQVHDAVAFTPDDLPGYAGALFDFVLDHPDLVMVDAWRRLERPTPTDTERERYESKLEVVDQMGPRYGPDGTYDAVDVLALVTAIASIWFATPPAIADLTSRDVASKRTMVTTTVGLLTARS